jgi:U4/U6.U5 tri-snRNP-associated protein 2
MSPLLQRVGELLRKMWYPKQFKGQVSPHQFLQTVAKESHKHFSLDKASNPLDFLEWVMLSIHSILTKCSKTRQTVISQTFFGELEIWTQQKKKGYTKLEQTTTNCWGRVDRKLFLYLGLNLPRIPLFKNAFNDVQISQVPLFQLLKKYNGVNSLNSLNTGRRYYRLSYLPGFLIVVIHRFNKNAFFLEKNQTIVNFPERRFPLVNAIPVPDHLTNYTYNLVASVTHTGNVNSGAYKVYINRAVENQWYEIQDLSVKEVLPQIVTLSEAYLQVFERVENI